MAPKHSSSPHHRSARRSTRRPDSRATTLVLTAVLVTAAAVFLFPGISSSSEARGDTRTSASERRAAPPRVSALQRRIAYLESRVSALESLLRSMGVDPEPTPTETDSPSAPPPSTATATATATATTTVTSGPTSSPTASGSPTASSTASSSPTSSSSPTASATSTTSPTSGPTSAPTSNPGGTPTGTFPTLASTGVPAGWQPTRTVSGSYTVSTPGAVVEDLRVQGDLIVAARDVTLRRVEVIGGNIDNFRGATCQNGLVIEDSTVRASGGTDDSGVPAVGAGGYTADNVLIDGPAEGFRVGGSSDGCGPVTITNSYANVVAPTSCADWHGDGLQGYGGAALTLRNTVLVLQERSGCYGTSAFFYPANQGNTSVDIRGLLVKGGGYPFRLGTPGSVQGLQVATGWGYGPLEVNCGLVSGWSAQVVTWILGALPVVVRSQGCG